MNKTNNSIYTFKNSPVIILKAFNIIFLALINILLLTFKYIERHYTKEITDSSKIKLNLQYLIHLLNNKYSILLFISLILLIIFSLFKYYFYWKNSNIVVDGEIVYSNKIGLFFKNKKQVNIKNITNVNLKRNIIYRFLGVYSVTMDINSSETATEFDYSIILPKREAFELSELISNHFKDSKKTDYNTCINSIDDKKDSHNIEIDSNKKEKELYNEYIFTNSEFFLHLIMNLSIKNIVLFIFGTILIFNESYIILIISLISIIKYTIGEMDKAYNLNVQRIDRKIVITYGFMSTNKFEIPTNKIISVFAEQSFIAKIFGYKCIKIESIGFSNNENETGLISLYLNKKKIEKFTNNIIPEFYDKLMPSYNDKTNLVIKRPVSAFYYYIIYLSIIFIPIGILIYIPINYIWIFALTLITVLFLSTYLYLNTKIYIDDKNIILNRGVFSSKTTIIPISKIESISINQNIIQKQFRLKSITIYFKGGSFGKTTENSGPFNENLFEAIISFYINGEK